VPSDRGAASVLLPLQSHGRSVEEDGPARHRRDTARRMAWAAHEGAQQHWDVTVIKATSFATLEVAK
jgi:hypothetical protein